MVAMGAMAAAGSRAARVGSRALLGFATCLPRMASWHNCGKYSGG